MSALPNIVLVHGAWADGSSWSAVIQRLQADGYRVTAPQVPMTALADDVARVRQVLIRQHGPTVVAGHSYGGKITALGTDAPTSWSGLHRGLRAGRRRVDRSAAGASTADPGSGAPRRRQAARPGDHRGCSRKRSRCWPRLRERV
jgi:pimeloyl-ACP methyl ester carboxylesterase